MKLLSTPLAGLTVVEPDVHRDPRGFFLESYHAEKYRRGGIDATFVQDNHSCSVAGTLRGLHAQLHRPQGKLVRVIEGTIFDVAVDLRLASPTLGRWFGIELSAGTFRQIYLPPGFAHGFCVLSPLAQVEYKCTAHYDPRDEIGVIWNDPDLAIDWPLPDPLLSERDATLPSLAQVVERLRQAGSDASG